MTQTNLFDQPITLHVRENNSEIKVLITFIITNK